MFGEKIYVGLALESNAFKIARVKVNKEGIKLLKMDRFSLVESIHAHKDTVFDTGNNFGDYGQKPEKEEEIFGFDKADTTSEQTEQEEEEINIAELEAQAQEGDVFALGNMDGDKKPKTNIMLLYNILNDISRKRINLATNIPAGSTNFQIVEDTSFGEAKKEQIVESIEEKLQAIYGQPKSDDFYAYEVRENGSLVLVSIDESPAILNILDETNNFYRGKLRIRDIYPDEVALIGLFRANYDPEPDEFTALLQFGEKNSRAIFLKGKEIFSVIPIFDEGTKSQNFLNVLFSKILFQLDSGVVSELNHIVIANNSLGDKAVEFFKNNFSSIEVEEFQYKDAFLDKGRFDDDAVSPFTTAIGLAAAAAGKDEAFPPLSLMPEYVQERQKIFKIRWHGIVLLVLIFLTFPVANYFYQQNANKIESLSSDLERTNAQIQEVQPIVNSANEISQNLTLLTTKLSVLDSLSANSKAWSAKLDILNGEMNNIPNSWFVSMSQTQDGTFLEGYTLYRNRIPAITDIFAEATLLNVNTEVIREKELFKFSLIVQEFSADSSIYSPDKPESIEQILNN